ncbi:uncharacterized protein LOC135378330 [Ornithodoros turicata]|uniref:uncharacterized protein LOC135378330 n=1 Tax=Ornithodoros turicata TaxID=34597 RepID=UPI00313A3329
MLRGTQYQMEMLRKKMEKKHQSDTPNHVGQELLRVLKENKECKEEVQCLKERLGNVSNLTGLAVEMQSTVKELRKLQKKMQKMLSREALPDETVELVAQSGVFISTASLNRAKSMSGANGCRLARDFIRILFSHEELIGRSVTGMQSNAHKERPAKEQVDPIRMGAVIEYCHMVCPNTEVSKIKQSIRTFLQRL